MARASRGTRIGAALLLFFALMLGTAFSAHAAGVMCSDFSEGGVPGIVDGYDPTTYAAISSASTFGIDMNCTIKNFPESMGGFPITNVNFYFPGGANYYIIFDNVYYYGNMSCNDPNNSTFWIYWAPGGYNNISDACQSFMVPVDALIKQDPPAQTTASIGVPFTYTITAPYLGQLDSNGVFNYLAAADAYDITNVVITDDLTENNTALLSYVSNTAYLVDTGTGIRTPLGSLNVTTSDNKHLTFSYTNNPALVTIPAGDHIEIDLTVVLDNNTAANYPNNTFTNTVNMSFDKTINGTYIPNLGAWPSTTLPMTIVGPNLVMNKTSTVTNLNVGSTAPFKIDVQNTGSSTAWDTVITDDIPAGMCSNPTTSFAAGLYASDGTTLVSSLNQGSDYTLSWTGGSASACRLTLTMLDSSPNQIGPNQHLIITYGAQLDAGTSPGQTFTNVAGATSWYGTSNSYAGRHWYGPNNLTDGTPGTPDYQDAWDIISATTGYFLLKQVGDVTTGVFPADTAFPGDTLRYTLQIQNFQVPELDNITITDDLGLNSPGAFVSGISIYGSNLPGTAVVNTCPSCGTGGAPKITITGLNLSGNTQYQIQFDVTLASAPPLSSGTIVYNQASLTGTNMSGTVTGVSDDPFQGGGPAQLGPSGDKTPITIEAPEALSKANPVPATATIGQQFNYTITVPATSTTVPLYDVKIFDTLPANLSFVSAQAVVSSGSTFNLTNTGTATNLILQDPLNSGIDIPAGQYATITVTVAVQNTTANFSGVTFTNSASYTYDKLNGYSSTQATGGGATTSAMTVVEPHLTVSKSVSYFSPAGKLATDPAAAGDVLQYTVTATNYGTSEAFDADIMDTLPSNVSLIAGSATAQINGSPDSVFVATPTTLPSGALDWGSRNGDGSLDIPAGEALVLTYQVTVLQVDGTSISNSVYADWTSLNDVVAGERTGDGCPSVTSPNTYCVGPVFASVSSLDPTALSKSVVSDSWTTPPSTGTDSTLRIGDTVVYNLALTLREGVTQNVVITDALPTGLAFDSLVGITPVSGSGNFTYTVASQPAPGATGTLTWNLGNVANAVDNNTANNTLIIQYRAKVVKNTLTQSPTTQTLSNTATLNYAINGVPATPKTASATINVWQPLLNVTKSAVPAGGGTVISAGELITYTVDITNNGSAPAYNTVLTDTLPVGLRLGGVTTTSITLAGTGVPILVSPYFSYNSTTGAATWNFDVSGSPDLYAIQPGQTLRVVYQVTADNSLGAGMMLVNNALVQYYYSFDSQDVPANSVAADRQVYGPTGAAAVQLTTAAATALSKQALVSTAAIGQPFTYEIRIPASPQPTAMYDVRVLDNISLATTGVTLSYVSSSAHLASNTRSWATLANTGTATNLILQDTASGGLDIPANDQLVVEVTLVLTDDPINNTMNKQFSNTATYTYDSINDTAPQSNGAPGASNPVTIVGPVLIMQKSGPSTMSTLAPGTFTLNVQNTGGSTAWQTTIKDILPNGATGGMCGSAPTNITARIYQSDGTTAVSAPLVNGTDFTVSFAGAPACTLTVAMTSSAAAIPPTDRLIVTFSAALDPNTAGSIILTNIAGATQWLSADPAVTAAGNIRTFTGPLTNGTPGVVDNQDAFQVTTQAPSLTFTKTVYDVTTGQSGATARPGDTLQYTLTIQNSGALGASNFSLTDELDKLNSTAMFVPGSLNLITVPAGANTSLTSKIGGSKGTGLVSISNLNVAPQGQAGDSLVIEFQATLIAVINNGTEVLNQAQIGSSILPTQLSDDPSITGTVDPTRTVITSAPAFRVLKTVQDVTSGTSIVMAGDTLRYTITVKNIGTENAFGVTLRDLIPAYTTYVAGSTTLNGATVADPGPGVSALQFGMVINSPANTTQGTMPADAGSTTTNVATITFDVQISSNVVNGTVISNQGFVNGYGSGSGQFPEQPSDDPATPVVNDPTSVIVGNLPLVYALKTVRLAGDVNGNGYVDPGDTLQYTITMTNSSATPATGVVLTDAIPANTTYVPNSVQMNSAAVADPAPNVSPLTNGMGIVSSGLTPPSPPSNGGTLAAGGTGTVTFEVTVNSGVAPGTIISNQGTVATAELPALLTDADGDPTNGFQPTTIVVGNVQQLSITKSVAVVGGGAAVSGSTLEYTIQATNIGMVPATDVIITDDLTPLSAQASYVANSATMNGSQSGVSFVSPVLTANYSAVHGDLAPGGSVVVRFDVMLNSTATGTITNTAQASWNTPAQTATATVTLPVGAIPGSASLTGFVWQDENFNKALDSGELDLVGWTVALYRNGQLLGTVLSGTDGSYHIYGVTPNAGTTLPPYEIRFSAPGAGPNTAMLGWADSPASYNFTNGMQRISNIVAASNDLLQNLNLPLTPNGVVYNSITRAPIAGATLTIVRVVDSSTTPPTTMPLGPGCFDDPVQQGQLTPGSGYYKFDLNFSDASSCPSGGDYLIQVTPPATGYTAGVSRLIPVPAAFSTTSFPVPNCPGNPLLDAVLGTPAYCEAQSSNVPPGTAVPPGPGTAYYLQLTLDDLQPGDSQIFNNHIPIDPTLNTAVAIAKTSALVNVTRAQLVPYTITFTNTLGFDLQDLSVVDTFPPGFKYVAGSGRMDGQKVDPAMTTTRLQWNISQLASKSSHTIKLLLIVGSGVSEGEHVNRAQVINIVTGGAASPVASATVRVTPDPTMDCTDIIGKVFDDRNLNGYQDEGEKGLQGVKIVSTHGLIMTTDRYGRFHLTCAAVPSEERGSNFILKLDDRTLPTGYRMTTENPLVERATRGKAMKFNFGATLHRVVSLDIADGVFEPGSTIMRPQWKPRIGLLLDELRKAPSVLRISYLADVEDPKVVKARTEAVKREIEERWQHGGYQLTIETEIFWRRGGPP